MKHFPLAIVIFVAGSQLAVAGPEPVQGDQKAAVPTPQTAAPCNWTGFYMGGNIGGAFAGNADLSLDLGGHWLDVVAPPDRNLVTSLGSRDLSASAFVAGGFAGYNYQWNHFVFGGEADIDYVGLRNSFNSGILTVNSTGDQVDFRASYQTDYRVTIGPRLGYAWNRFLIYGTGGLAIGNVEFSQAIKGKDGAGFRDQDSTDDTQVGWTAGGGIQYCVSEHWSARVEYRYTNLECADFSSAGNKTGGVVDFSGFTAHHEACLTFQSVTAGLAFKF